MAFFSRALKVSSGVIGSLLNAAPVACSIALATAPPLGMVNPSPASIENLVREIVDCRLQDGQLDRSRMNITDIRRVEASLVRNLTAVSHPRIRYPGT